VGKKKTKSDTLFDRGRVTGEPSSLQGKRGDRAEGENAKKGAALRRE